LVRFRAPISMITDSNNQKIANATLLFKASNLNLIKELI
jgi:hypothetical protein